MTNVDGFLAARTERDSVPTADAIAGSGSVEQRPDDSGPNLLVRGVELLVVVAVAAVIVASVRRLRRRPRRGGEDEPG